MGGCATAETFYLLKGPLTFDRFGGKLAVSKLSFQKFPIMHVEKSAEPSEVLLIAARVHGAAEAAPLADEWVIHTFKFGTSIFVNPEFVDYLSQGKAEGMPSAPYFPYSETRKGFYGDDDGDEDEEDGDEKRPVPADKIAPGIGPLADPDLNCAVAETYGMNKHSEDLGADNLQRWILENLRIANAVAYHKEKQDLSPSLFNENPQNPGTDDEVPKGFKCTKIGENDVGLRGNAADVLAPIFGLFERVAVHKVRADYNMDNFGGGNYYGEDEEPIEMRYSSGEFAGELLAAGLEKVGEEEDIWSVY